MAFLLDSLVFLKRLRQAGISQKQAEAHAEVTRDFVLANVVSRDELAVELAQLRAAMKAFEEALVNRVTKIVAAILIGTLTVAGVLVTLATNIGKLFGH